MKVVSENEYKSLEPFKPLSLPDFLIISGLNGSGKTQFLKGIAENFINVFDDADAELTRRKFVDANTLAPNKAVDVNPYTLAEKPKQLFQQYTDYKSRKESSPSLRLEQRIRDNKSQKIISSIAQQTGKEIDDLEESDFLTYFPLHDPRDKTDIFSQSFSYIFKRYHVHQYDNDVARVRAWRGVQTNYLDDDQFLEKYGEPPWEFVNKLLEEANLDYYIESPEKDHRDATYTLRLTNKYSKKRVDFTDLSSGEKVLMSLSLSLYNSDFDQEFPEILLMDEPDASLHPSMTRHYLSVIENVFVKDKKIKVIASTHSPSTVALANNENLYIMEKRVPRLRKVTKDSALKVLTSGVPALSVRYENRRQVFTESKIDQFVYEKVFLKLKERLSSEVALNFISSGTDGSGCCEQVKAIVTTLTGYGNDCIYGIIDFDDGNVSKDHVIVVGDSNRYSLENYIFDPLMVIAFLLSKKYVDKADFKLEETENFTEIRNFEEERLQSILDIYLEKLKSHIRGDLDDTRVGCDYLNGASLSVPRWFLNFNGHQLEARMQLAWRTLNKYQETGELMKEIVGTIVDDLPDLLSKDLSDTFATIQEG